LLLISDTDHATIKVTDFGFARRVHTPESLTSRVGTPTYVAPEVSCCVFSVAIAMMMRGISSCILSFVLQVLKNIPHDQRVDLWSVGVVIFVLLVGYPPFLDENQNKLFQKIRNGEWEFVEEDWKQISNDAKDLIKGLLVVDPADRCSISDCLRSAWIHEDESNLATDLTDSLLTLRTKKSRLRSMARVFKGVGDKTEATEVATQAQVPVLELFKPPTPEGSDNLAIV
jgi:calcium/calmodulin-dependent protein kinase I